MQEVLIDFAHLIAIPWPISVKISTRTCSTALYFPIYLLHTLPSPHPLLITYSFRKHTTKYVHYTGSRTPSECILANDFTNQRAQNSTPPRQRHRVGMLVGSIVSITKSSIPDRMHLFGQFCYSLSKLGRHQLFFLILVLICFLHFLHNKKRRVQELKFCQKNISCTVFPNNNQPQEVLFDSEIHNFANKLTSIILNLVRE